MKSIFCEVEDNNYLSINHNVPLLFLHPIAQLSMEHTYPNPPHSPFFFFFSSLSLSPIQVKALEIRTQSNENY